MSIILYVKNSIGIETNNIISKFTMCLIIVLSSVINGDLIQHSSKGTYGCRRSFGFGVYDASVNKTVIVWNAEKMSVYVRAFDHVSQQWEDTVMAKALDYTGTWDYHNYPTMVIAPDGHYLIFYFKHSGNAYMVRSPAPHSIQGTWTHITVSSSDLHAYPMPVVMGTRVYLFYSKTHNPIGTTVYRSYRFIKSTDNGQTWNTPKTVINSEDSDPDGYDEVYLHGFDVDTNANKILLGWEMKGGPNGHNKGGKNNYFAFFDCDDEKMYTASNSVIGNTVNYTDLNRCLVDTATNPSGAPFGYTTFPIVLPDGAPAVAYRLNGTSYISQWRNSSWQRSEITVGGFKDYQRTVDGKYVMLAGGYSNMTVWESSNGVNGWTKKSGPVTLPQTNNSDSRNCGFIDNFRPEVQWMSSTYDYSERTNDYSGSWPVVTFGEVGTGVKHSYSKGLYIQQSKQRALYPAVFDLLGRRLDLHTTSKDLRSSYGVRIFVDSKTNTVIRTFILGELF